MFDLDLYNCRFDLDQLDTPEKYPDLFNVVLQVEVSTTEKPKTDNYPWEKFDPSKLGPKILFSSKDEVHEVFNEFSKLKLLATLSKCNFY